MLKTNAQDRDKSEMNLASRKKTKTVLNITLELSIAYTYPSFRFYHSLSDT